jgi:GDPmannose 4,6-dehydratase
VTALIFGANGQDGPYLLEALQEKGVETVGVSRSGPWKHADVSAREDVERLVREVRPDYVFQLAANSTTRHDATFENHGAVRLHCPTARVFIPGSGLQFRNTGAPIDEDAPFEASSPYSVARIHSVYAARYYRKLGIRAYVGYLFHHDSPRRGPRHVGMLVASAARRIGAGSQEVLELADVSVVKEWTFAGDVARAMVTLVQQDQVSEVVIGSGEGHSIAEWAARCFGAVGRDWQDHVRSPLGKTSETPALVSRPARMESLGWRPRVTFEQLALMMMNEPA